MSPRGSSGTNIRTVISCSRGVVGYIAVDRVVDPGYIFSVTLAIAYVGGPGGVYFVSARRITQLGKLSIDYQLPGTICTVRVQ